METFIKDYMVYNIVKQGRFNDKSHAVRRKNISAAVEMLEYVIRKPMYIHEASFF